MSDPVQTATNGWRRATRVALWAGLCLAAALSGCGDPEPRWPPDGWSPGNTPWLYNGDERGVSTSTVVRRAMTADTTVGVRSLDPGSVMLMHLSYLTRNLDPHASEDAYGMGISDTTTWADIEAFYTRALAGTGLRRDSTADGVADAATWPAVKAVYADQMAQAGIRGGLTPGTLASAPPRVRSRHAAWVYDDRRGDDDLVFSVVYSVVESGHPGRTYRFLSVREPQRTRR